MVAYVREPRRPKLTTWLIWITIATSVLAIGVGLVLHLALIPSRVWHGEIWRLATFPFVQPSPMSLVFTCVVIFWFGGGLRVRWGSAKLARYLAGLVLAAGVGTSLAGLVSPLAAWWPHVGGWVIADALLIAWGLQFPDERIAVYWVLVVSGRQLAYGVAALMALFALYRGIIPMLPELITCALALFVMTNTHRRWWLRLRSYLIHRRLGTIAGDRHGGPYAN